MNISKSFLAAGLALVMAAPAYANEVLLTQGEAKSAGQVALDFVNSGQATAFEFEIVVPRGATVDTKSCLSEIPSSHTGACRFDEKNGRVIVMVYSNSNELLPEGVVPLGRINVSGGARAKVQNVLVSDVSGKPLAAKGVDAAKPAASASGRVR